MDFEKTENYKRITKCVKDFESKRDTLLAIFSIGDDGATLACGEPRAISSGVYVTLKEGLAGKDERVSSVVSAILSGIWMLADEDSSEGATMREILYNMLYVEDEESSDCDDDEDYGKDAKDTLMRFVSTFTDVFTSARNKKRTKARGTHKSCPCDKCTDGCKKSSPRR